MARLLIAEDAAAIASVLKRYLERQGYEVETVPDGEAALARLRRGDVPDLVIADLTMPRLGGRDLVREMREDKHLRAVPVLLMSGAAFKPEAFPPEGQYQAWLGKPFELQTMLSTVQRLLGRGA
ncbi:MAG: response regulator [Thermaerobacter sp.]|nr:response regulator [Thermaerobacter sp.]